MSGDTLIDHASLPDIATAPLPATYEAARRALAICSDLDECQMWADRAEALASYARQAKDDALRKMCDRIQARAIDRCGELLRTIPPAPGTRTDLEPHTANGTRSTRTDAAKTAGLSKRQKDTALQVNNVPRDEFEQLVESDDPPTITDLAARGTVKRPTADYLAGRDPSDFECATRLIGLAEDIIRQVKAIDLTAALRGLDARERDDAIVAYGECINWLTEIHGGLCNGV